MGQIPVAERLSGEQPSEAEEGRLVTATQRRVQPSRADACDCREPDPDPDENRCSDAQVGPPPRERPDQPPQDGPDDEDDQHDAFCVLERVISQSVPYGERRSSNEW